MEGIAHELGDTKIFWGYFLYIDVPIFHQLHFSKTLIIASR